MQTHISRIFLILCLPALASCAQDSLLADEPPAHAGAHAQAAAVPAMPGMTGMPGMNRAGMTSHMQDMQTLMPWMSGAELAVVATEPRPAENAALVQAGGTVYASRCTPCHGEKGNGEGPQASRLAIPPRDFTAGVFKLRSTPSGALPRDEDLFRTISSGMHGTAMLPWTMLSEGERWALVAYVKSFSPRFVRAAAVESIAVPAAPHETPALIEGGRELYATLKCNACHGDDGRGNGLSAATLVDKNGRPIPLRDLGEGRFKRGTELRDIYVTLRSGLDGSPMPSFDQAITPDQTWALAAYMRQVSQRNKTAMAAPQTGAAPMGGMGMMGGHGMMMGGSSMATGGAGMAMGMMGHDPEEMLGMMINMSAMMTMDGAAPAPAQ